MTRVALLDTGVGNVGSVRRAFERLGAEVVATSDPALVAESARVVLPGVGAFAPARARLASSGLEEGLRAAVGRGARLLGRNERDDEKKRCQQRVGESRENPIHKAVLGQKRLVSRDQSDDSRDQAAIADDQRDGCGDGCDCGVRRQGQQSVKSVQVAVADGESADQQDAPQR